MTRLAVRFIALVAFAIPQALSARVCNVKVVSDSRPDFSDMSSLIYSVMSPCQTPDEKCRAMWRWITRCRRQQPHSLVHGVPVHDPIMFYNDFGYSFCSDYAGMNCGIWHSMGLPVKFWDITLHTVSECFYDDRWHMFDNSMSAYYTLCDEKTVAGVEDIGKPGACEASNGKTEDAHIALVHCIGATSRYGFLTGADTQRSLQFEGSKCFNPKGLKYRNYYNGFDLGHRYVLTLRDNETYSRYAAPQGENAEYYIALENGKSPQKLGTFGNGLWVFKPNLTSRAALDDLDRAMNLAASQAGLKPENSAKPAEAIVRVSAANVVVSSKALLDLDVPGASDGCSVAVSTDLGHSWNEVWKSTKAGAETAEVALTGVATSHQFLVRISLTGQAALKGLEIRTITQVNKLTLPILTLGLNTVDVVAGEPTETILFWPEIQDNKFKESCLSSANLMSEKGCEWHGCLYLERPGTGNMVYALEAPGEMTEITYGGRFYNRAPQSSIAIAHSTDEGKTWTKSWELTDTKPPWDTIHFETVTLPAGTRRVLVRYTLNSPRAGKFDGCSVYSVRMNASYRPRDSKFQPLEVTYNWSEWKDSQWAERSHTQLIGKPGERYFIGVGGDDLPRTNWLRVNLQGAVPDVKYGYSDGVDLRSRPFVRTRHVWGKDLALGKKYSFSVPSGNNWGGGDPDMTRLTDESVASTYGMGTTYKEGPIWTPGQNPVIALDLEKPEKVAAVRIHVTGYPCDFYKGPFSDVEILTSTDGKSFASQGTIKTQMTYKDVDGDFLMPENGRFESWVFPLIFEKPVEARYIQYKVANPRMHFDTSEIMAYDSVKIDEWKEPLAMPLDKR
jgi:hypothetical protein